MEFRKVQTLRGPNIWASFAVLEAWVDLGKLKDFASDELPGFNERLMAWLPTLIEHRCSVGRRGGFFERLRRGTYQAHILEHVALELQTLAGSEVGFGRTRETSEDGVYKVAIEYEDQELARGALDVARALCLAAVEGLPFDVSAEIQKLREVADRGRPAPGTAAIIQAAGRRKIPVSCLNSDGLIQLGYGIWQRRVLAGQTDRNSALAEFIARDAGLVRTLLRAVGVPVPKTQEDSAPALPRSASGVEWRLLVIGERVVAATRKEPAAAGQASTPRPAVRANGETHFASFASKASQTANGLGTDPSTGGPAGDVTDRLHPEVIARALEAARVVGLEVAGIDIAAADISRPLEEQGGVILAVDAHPDLGMHLTPASAPSLAVGEALVTELFPEGQTGRVPIAGITGVNGKTTTTRLLAHIVGRTRRGVGMTCTEGIYIDGRRIETGDCSGPRSARSVLQHPRVEAAILETARGGILREGLGFDRCDVAVVTNIAEGDHLGVADVDTPEQLARVKRTLVEAVAPTGAAILKADDPLVAAMAGHCPGSVVFFAQDGSHPVLVRHRGGKGRTAFVRDSYIVLAEGEQEIPLVSLERVPLTHGGRIGFQVENALAAAAAAWRLSVPCEAIRVGLETFGSGLDKVPGRFNLFEVNGATVIVDYGHNASSLACLLEALEQFPHGRRAAVYSAAGDRRDCDLIRQGAMLGEAFDRVILFEDHYTRGRKPGEIMALFGQGLALGSRVEEVCEIQGAVKAMESALAAVRPGELLLMQADEIDESVAFMRRYLAAGGVVREIDFNEAVAILQPEAAGLCQPVE
jgi:cyanophycin synthetase